MQRSFDVAGRARLPKSVLASAGMTLKFSHAMFENNPMKLLVSLRDTAARICVVAFLWFASVAAAAADETALFVEGYSGRLSYAPGEEVTLHVSTSATQFAVEIARLGAQREIVWSQTRVPGARHAVPHDASSRGCRWPESLRVLIPQEWRSGYYEVRLRAADGGFVRRGRRTAESSCFFVVRSAAPGRDSKILLQLTTNTYEAYNAWGGFSLYAHLNRNRVQGVRVSFDRPPASQFGRWELGFVQWAERNGYAIDYAVNSDLEFHPEMLAHYRLVLSVGHDEYWSAPMRDNLEAFIAKGGNVAFLSGNTCYWQVRSEDKGRALVGWKQNYFQDPVFQKGDFRTLSTIWSHHLINRPENLLTGVSFNRGGYHRSNGILMDGSGAFTVHRPDHWTLAGTGLQRGSEFGGKDTIVGYECDGCEIRWENGLPYPTGSDGTPKDFEIICTAPARNRPLDTYWYEKWDKNRPGGLEGHAVLGLYTKPGGGTVLTVGTTDWAHGLSGGDPVVERITKNVLDRFSK